MTLSKIGLKMGCGIESGAKTVARFILCGMIHLETTEASKKANKYTFWSYDPRRNARNPYAEVAVRFEDYQKNLKKTKFFFYIFSDKKYVEAKGLKILTK